MMRVSRAEIAGAAAVVLAALLACAEGGANSNQKGVGDQPGGVKVGLGDIAVAPFGNYVLFAKDHELGVGWIETGTIESLPVQDPSRLAFSKQRPVVYVGSESTGEILAVDVTTRRVLWHTAVAETATDRLRIESSKDDAWVLAGSPDSVRILDAATGEVRGDQPLPDGALVDLEILGDSKRAIVVQRHQFIGDAPNTQLLVIDLSANTSVDIDVPNCSDDIVVSSDGMRAFLAPTTCSRDPVSVIELAPGNEHYSKNLPGFGPLALSPDGTTAVGFLDRDSIDLTLFSDPKLAPSSSSAKYHLMLLDSATLKYEFVAVGDDLPRFAVTPDGNVLMVDSGFFTSVATRLFDVPSRSFRDISGPSIVLENFALSSDSKHAYVLQTELDDLDVDAAQTTLIDPGFLPSNLNISADDRTLFLRKSQSEICIFDLETRVCQRRFQVGAQL